MRAGALAISVIGVVAVVGVGRSAIAATNFNVTNSGASTYVIDGVPGPGGVGGPALTLIRGQTYTFTVNALGHPFWITTARGAATASTNAFPTGITNNGTPPNGVGTVTFVVPASAPATLFYQCSVHDGMGGTLNIISQPVPSMTPVTLALLVGLLFVAAVVLLRKRARLRS